MDQLMSAHLLWKDSNLPVASIQVKTTMTKVAVPSKFKFSQFQPMKQRKFNTTLVWSNVANWRKASWISSISWQQMLLSTTGVRYQGNFKRSHIRESCFRPIKTGQDRSFQKWCQRKDLEQLTRMIRLAKSFEKSRITTLRHSLSQVARKIWPFCRLNQFLDKIQWVRMDLVPLHFNHLELL